MSGVGSDHGLSILTIAGGKVPVSMPHKENANGKITSRSPGANGDTSVLDVLKVVSLAGVMTIAIHKVRSNSNVATGSFRNANLTDPEHLYNFNVR